MRPLLVLSLWLLPTLWARGAESPPPSKVLLWGIQQGCDLDGELQQALVQRAQALGEDLVTCPALFEAKRPLLKVKDPACSGSACVEQVPATCRLGPVRVIGGEIMRGSSSALRLWLVDAPTLNPADWRVQYRDDFCEGCDTTALRQRVQSMAAALLRAPSPPRSQPPPGPEPSYCTAPPPVQVDARAATGPGPVLLFSGSSRAASAALRERLVRLGFEVVGEKAKTQKCRDDECMAGWIGKFAAQGVTQAMGVDPGPAGRSAAYTVWRFDRQSGKTQSREVTCDGCDKQRLASAIGSAAGALAQSCVGDCAPVRTTAVLPPEDACRKFPTPRCVPTRPVLPPGALVSSAPPPPQKATPLKVPRPTSHRYALGTLWTLTGLSLIAGGVFAALNYSDWLAPEGKHNQGYCTMGGKPFDNCFFIPMVASYALGGVGLLIVAPTHYLMTKEETVPPAPPRPTPP